MTEKTNTVVEYMGISVDTNLFLRAVRLAVRMCLTPRQVYGVDISEDARQNGALWIAFSSLFRRMAGGPSIDIAPLVALGHDLIEEVGGLHAYVELYGPDEEFPEEPMHEPISAPLQQGEAVA